jgi:hypothetical protein
MDKWAGPVAEILLERPLKETRSRWISLERGEISLTAMEISPY